MLAIMPTDEAMSIVRVLRDRAAFTTTVAAESRRLQRPVIEEDLVVIPVVIIPNHAPATNAHAGASSAACVPQRFATDRRIRAIVGEGRSVEAPQGHPGDGDIIRAAPRT